MSSNADKIAELRRQADELEEADRVFRTLRGDYRLAIDLHKLLCRHNHTDGCSWYYEVSKGIDNWSGSAHGEYLGRAQRLTNLCTKHNISTDDVIDIVKLADGL